MVRKKQKKNTAKQKTYILSIIASVLAICSWGIKYFVYDKIGKEQKSKISLSALINRIHQNDGGIVANGSLVNNGILSGHDVNITGNVNINNGTQNGKLETSPDPRKELQNIGVAWNGDNFLQAVKEGDERIVKLFLEGGIRIEASKSEGRPLPIMLALNTFNPSEILSILIRNGLDVNNEFSYSSGSGPGKMTLLGSAIERGNKKLVNALLNNKVDKNQSFDTFGMFGLGRPIYPLDATIYWEHPDLANLLLDNGADISTGNYSAYRTIQESMKKPIWRNKIDILKKLSKRVRPTGSTLKKMDTELRLNDVETELTEVALESMKTYRGSSERNKYEQRYNELQNERKRLKSQLGYTN